MAGHRDPALQWKRIAAIGNRSYKTATNLGYPQETCYNIKMTHKILTIITALLIITHVSIAQEQTPSALGLPEGAIARFGKGGLSHVQYSPDGTQIAVGSSIGTRWVQRVAFASDGNTLVSLINGMVYLWDASTQNPNFRR